MLISSGCPRVWCWRVYTTMIRPIMLYAFPAWCNVAASTLEVLTAIESRVKRILGTQPSTDIVTAAVSLCNGLVTAIKKDANHPLRCAFNWDPRRSSARCSKNVLCTPHFAKTSRFQQSLTLNSPTSHNCPSHHVLFFPLHVY